MAIPTTASRSTGEAPPVRRRPWRLLVVAVVVAVLAAVLWSYGHALNGPGNDSWGIRSTEWLKNHGLTWAVNDVERWWYDRHRPKVGGLPSGSLRPLIVGPTPVTSGPVFTVPPPAHLPAPPPVPPIASPALPGEGQWKPLGQTVGGALAMYAAFLRPDPVHTSLVTAVAWMDPTLVRFAGYAGVLEPGSGPWSQQAPIPPALRPQLLAAFNSGFKMRDARGGYYADGRTVRSLVPGGATVVIGPDGKANVGEWGRDFTLGPGVVFARQNLSLIVDNAQPVPGLADSSARWGSTIGNRVYVWRSGLGVTANGALVYAAGNDLSATTLAGVLVRAGAVRAMELDINSTWVDYFTYAPLLDGQLDVLKLLPDMRPPTSDYLTASSRDFIAVFRRF